MLPVRHTSPSDSTATSELQSFISRGPGVDHYRTKDSTRSTSSHHPSAAFALIYQRMLRCHRWVHSRPIWLRTLITVFLSLLILVLTLTLLPTPTRRPPQPMPTTETEINQPVTLPPSRPHGRCPIYSYVVPLPEPEIDIGHQMEVWEHYWWSIGFAPIFLTPEYAKQHPLYEQYLARVRTYPNFASANARTYEEACYLRWLAFSAVGGGIFLDFDILYTGNVTYLHQFMDATDCGRTLTFPVSDEINFPMVTIGSPAAVDTMIQLIYNAQVEPDVDHTSDMILLQYERVPLKVRNLGEYTHTEFGFNDPNNALSTTPSPMPPHHINFMHFSHAAVDQMGGSETDGVHLMVRWIQLKYFNTHQMLHLDLAPPTMKRPNNFGPFFPLYLDPSELSVDLLTHRQRRIGHPNILHRWYDRVFGVKPLPSYARDVGLGWERCWRSNPVVDKKNIIEWWEQFLDRVCFQAIQQGNEVDYVSGDYSWHRRQLHTVTYEQLRSTATPLSITSLFPPVRIDPNMWQTTAGAQTHQSGSELVLMLSVVHPWFTLAHGYMAERISSDQSFAHWYRHLSLTISPDRMSTYDDLILHTLIRLVKEIGYHNGVDSDFADLEPCFKLLNSPIDTTWSTIAATCFPHVRGVHLFLPGSSTDFCSSMCAFERSTGVATGAAGGSYVCGRVGHSSDPRFQTCQELTQTQQLQGIDFNHLFTTDKSIQSDEVNLTAQSELIEEIRTKNFPSLQLFHLIRQHIQQQAAPIL